MQERDLGARRFVGRAPSARGLDKAAFVDGDDLRNAFEAATHCVQRHRDAINALNVFPVPDGDTGTNMLLTTRSANDQSRQATSSSAGTVMAAMARGALLGARGNSGVILSQFFHGLELGLQGKDQFDGEDLARAFELASESAYRSVSQPVEGTMLTVIRDLSLAASHHIEDHDAAKDVLSIWKTALVAGKESLSRTPMQLPVLREAGVVDAGGQGVVTFLEGAFRYLSGENVDELELEICVPVYSDSAIPGVSSVSLPSVQEEYLAATEDVLYGYCTQLLIEGQELDVDTIRQEMSSLAQSTVVVGNDSLVRVHVHAHDPGPVISYAVSLGTVGQVSLDNIDQQHREFVALHREEPRAIVAEAREEDGAQAGGVSAIVSPARPEIAARVMTTPVAVAAVVTGEGLVELFKVLGCAAVASGGQSMNPSAQELLEAAGSTGAKDVILLPNNPNVILAARQAASIAASTLDLLKEKGEEPSLALHVVPCRTIPQGVAAILAFNPDETLDVNLEAMEKTIGTVTTIEVTRAVRPATIGGLSVQNGQFISLLDDELVAAGDTAVSVLQEALSKATGPEHPGGGSSHYGVLTLYWGEEVQEAEAQEAEAELRKIIPDIQTEVVYGGQPLYHYIVSLE